MQSSTQLPDGYELHGSIDLSKNKGLALLLNLVGLALFFLFGWIFVRIAILLRPDLTGFSGQVNQTGLMGGLALLVGLMVGQVILHEALHGLFFWLFTRARPRYGFKGLYAYAAAPDWYLPRNQHLVVGMAPLVGITLVGLALLPFVPASVVLALLLVVTANAAGAVGDMIVGGWLLLQPATALVRDTGDAVAVYRPRASASSEDWPG